LALGLAVLALGLGACAGRGKLVQRKAAQPIVLADLQPAAAYDAPAAEAVAAPQAVSITVAKGDSLWALSRRHLGRGARYPEVARANAILDPHLIHPGQVLSFGAGQGVAAARPAAPKSPSKDEAAQYGWKRQVNRAYTVGERLTFAVQYGNITAGYATLSIPEAVEVSGRPAFHVVAEARTHPFFETFFKVRDRIESFIDVEHGFPWRYEKHLREGGYSADAFYLFDHRRGRMTEPDKGKDVAVPIGTQDVLSCFYWFRTLPLNVGDETVFSVTADDMKTYDLKVDVLKKERVKTLAGDFDTILVQPHLKFQGVFQQKGEVFIWITDDARRIPVKVRSKIAIGSININLQSAEWVEPAGN
jgi:hypothetical protein